MTFRDRVAAFLKENPGRWISAEEFEPVGGRQAWRTRIADCRTQLGMTIENRVRYIERADGTKFTRSEYRFIPPVTDLIELSEAS